MIKTYLLEDKSNLLQIKNQKDIFNIYSGYFGRIKNNILYLKYIEATYLLYKKKIIVINKNNLLFDFKKFFLYSLKYDNNFELQYIVYKDLRERGYYLQINNKYFRVYSKGDHPLKSKSKYFLFINSERINLSFEKLIDLISLTKNTKKELIIAIVDEESEITYYQVKQLGINNSFLGKPSDKKISLNNIYSILLKERVIIFTDDYSIKLHTEYFYGKQIDENTLQLSFVEALYLLEKNILTIYDSTLKKISIGMFIKQSEIIESNFQEKYEVYKDLRNRFFIPKTGFKFGSHFRVYETFLSINNISHSKYLVHVIPKNYIFKYQILSRAIRLSNSVKKKMIFASFFSSIDIKYIEIERIKL